MLFFRKKTIFHAEEAMPDQEELRQRFRRRVLGLTFLGFVAVLAIPVAKELQSQLHAILETRRLAETILATRSLASYNRVPISLELDADGRTWRRTGHASSDDCNSPLPGPEQTWATEVLWKLQLQNDGGETFLGKKICLHPRLGLLLDSIQVATGKLLITALRAEDESQPRESAHLLIRSFGSDLQLLNHWNP